MTPKPTKPSSTTSTSKPPSSTTTTKPPSSTNPRAPTFPPSSGPRTWLITNTVSPIGVAVARAALNHGDNVVAGVRDVEMSGGREDAGRGEYEREFVEFWEGEVRGEEPVLQGSQGKREDGKDGKEGQGGKGKGEKGKIGREGKGKGKWRERCKIVGLDARIMGQCQAAISEAIKTFGNMDILFCCSSEALIGTVEELAASPQTQALVREQMETNFFGPVNVIKAALPVMRKKHAGHIIVLTGITGHLGTPGLGMYCASNWALEGFCDSLAYEIAPFNIKVSIVQPTIEIGVLTNKIVSAPLLPQYAPKTNKAPLFRGILENLITRIQGPQQPSALTSNHVSEIYPRLSAGMKSALLAETVNAITAIGGHENPPARHIVDQDGVGSVKEKLKTVSEELEDFVEVSCAVDVDQDGEGGEEEDEEMDG